MNILLVEDSTIDCNIISKHVKECGFQVLLATNGSRARRIMHVRRAPRLVLLDWMVPDMDGIQLCREDSQPGGKRPVC